MPRWRKGRGGFAAPIEHLSADRLADIVNAERSANPDLPRLNMPLPAPEALFMPEGSPPADETLVNGWDESALPAEPSPAEPPPELSAAAMAPPAPPPPDLSSDASSSDVKTSVLSKIGRHRRPTSLRSVALGFRRGLFTAHALALMGIIGILVVATAVLGVS